MINNKINENNNNIENDEKEMLIKLNELYNSLDNKDRNIDEIINKIKKIIDYKNEDKIKYLNSLLNPEQYKDVKMPSTIPIPSCTYSFHTSFITQPNNDGIFRYIINPNFLYKQRMKDLNSNHLIVGERDEVILNSFRERGKNYYTVDYLSSGIQFSDYDKGMHIEGIPGSLQANSINLNQNVPDIYLKYRLVSASVIIKYIDKLEKSSGIIGGTIVIDKMNNIAGHGEMITGGYGYITDFTDKNIFKYYDIKLIRNTFYYKEVNCIDGLKLVYFPIDNSYEEFVDIIDIDDVTNFDLYNVGKMYGRPFSKISLELNDNYKGGFYFYFFTEGGTPGTKYKIDLYCNFECLPNLNKFNYLSYNTNNMNITNNEKQEIINIIQNKPINKIKDFTNILDWKGILKKMKNHSINITSELNKKRDYNQINLEESEEEEEEEKKDEEKEIEPKENKDKEIKIKKENIVNIHNRMKERGKKKMEILNKKKNNPLYEFTEEEKKIIEDINKENIEDSNEIKKIEEEINNLNKIN